MRIRRMWTTMLALLAAFTLLVAACADDDSDSAESVSEFDGDPTAADDTADDDTAAPQVAADAPADDLASDDDMDEMADDTTDDRPDDADTGAFTIEEPATPDGQIPTALTPADLGRDIVFRAEIEVEVGDVTAASAEAAQRIRAMGGLVFGQTTSTEPEPRTVLTFKVLPADFDAALAELGGVGAIVRQSISADDVTERVVDLESRIATSAASVIRLRDLLDDAGDVNIIAQLENQLLERETTLEQLRGQLRTLQDQVRLATITLTIVQSPTVVPPAGLVVDTWLGDDAESACPGSSELEIGEGDTAVLCVEVENVGETALTDIELESQSLRLRTADFEIVEGDVDDLAPRGRLVATLELEVEDGRVRRREVHGGFDIDVVATGVPAGPEVGTAPRSSASVLLLVESEDDPLPGFGDALSGGVDALQLVVGVLLIVVGVALPFLPIVAAVAALFWWRNRRRDGDEDRDGEYVEI